VAPGGPESVRMKDWIADGVQQLTLRCKACFLWRQAIGVYPLLIHARTTFVTLPTP